MNWKGKKVAVIGLARSGLAAVQKLHDIGAEPFVSEMRLRNEFKALPLYLNNIEFGGHSEEILKNELIIVSPGVPLSIPILQKARQKKIPIWSELEFGFQLIKNTFTTIIAITGSNGKSTTTSLIHHILRRNGKKAILAGNIGLPLSSFPIEKEKYEYIVLEVSSFQLDAIDKFKPNIAVLLNITPDHLDRYDTFASYKKSKLQIGKNQTFSDIVVLNYDDDELRRTNNIGSAKKILYSVHEKANECVWFNNDKIFIQSDSLTSFLNSNQLQIQGLHNVSNAIASTLVCVLCKLHPYEICMALQSFKGLEHRLEWVAEINNRIFINDSKATNCVAVERALTSFDKPIQLIMGGYDKNEDFSSLILLIKRNVMNLIVFGETKDQIIHTFQGCVSSIEVKDLQEAVQVAYKASSPGEYILLSPGCASYDMYNNFEERGAHFKKLVRGIQE